MLPVFWYNRVMSLNCSEIEAVIKTLPGEGLVTGFSSPDPNSIVLTVTTGQEREALLVSAGAGECRIHKIDPPSSKERTPLSRFAQFCNSHLGGCRLQSIRQHLFSRIVIMEFSGNSGEWRLVARLWGNGSNIIITDSEFRIVECLKRYPQREEWPGEIFPLERKAGDPGKYPVRDIFYEGDINLLIERFYNDMTRQLCFTRLHDQITRVLTRLKKQAEQTIRAIEKKSSSARADTWLGYGELARAYMHKIRRGMTSITLEDFETGNSVSIPLKAELDPAANIEYLFKKYRKIKQGQANWQRQMKEAETRLETLEKLWDNFQHADSVESLEEIEAVLTQFQKTGKESQGKTTRKKSYGRVFILDDGHVAYVSRSAREASEMLTRIARGNDYWFHIRDNTGSHVVVKYRNNQELSDRSRLEAAHLALHYSKGRGSEFGDIYFTRVKYLHRSKGGPYGLVFPTQEKNIQLDYDETILNGVLDRESPDN
jgi:predicted ribosome quality control (RQC) complex YloA/Tae2 family protein